MVDSGLNSRILAPSTPKEVEGCRSISRLGPACCRLIRFSGKKTSFIRILEGGRGSYQASGLEKPVFFTRLVVFLV